MKLRLRWQGSHRERGHRILGGVRVALLVFGSLALGFCALAYFEAAFSEFREQHDFEQRLTLPDLPYPAAQAAVSRLEIPRLGIGVMVHEGVGSGTLRIGAGHVPGTAPAGDRGNVVIAAHRDTFFRGLRKIQPDDTILLETLAGTYRYSVEWTRVVDPSDREVMEASHDPLLTLITCYPFYYVGPAPERFIVRARQVEAR